MGSLLTHSFLHILGRPGWGIAWYVNGSLIPELVLRRGKTYTFIVEGGDDPSLQSSYHPLYITNLIGGGRLQNLLEDQEVRELILLSEKGSLSSHLVPCLMDMGRYSYIYLYAPP